MWVESKEKFSSPYLKNSYSYLLHKVRGCGNVFNDYISIKLQCITEGNVPSVADVCKRNIGMEGNDFTEASFVTRSKYSTL
jgi:hypothetical protein